MKQVCITRLIYFRWFFQLQQSFVFSYDFFGRCFVYVDFDPHVYSLIHNCIFPQSAPQSLSSVPHLQPHPSGFSWCVNYWDTASGHVCSYWCSLYLINFVALINLYLLQEYLILTPKYPENIFLWDGTKSNLSTVITLLCTILHFL